MRLSSFPFALKQERLEQFWEVILETVIASKKADGRFIHVLEEIDHADIDVDVLKIWLRIFSRTLENPLVPNNLKLEILNRISKNRLFMCPGSTHFGCLENLQIFFERLIALDASHLPLPVLFALNNLVTQEFSQASFYEELKEFENVEYQLAGQKFSNIYDLENFIEEEIVLPLKNELGQNPDLQYVELRVCW